MLQGAMRLAPGHAGAHLEKAIAYWQLGRWPAVLREYKTYRELARMPNLNGPWCKEEPLTRASEVLISSVMRYAESAWLPQTDSTKQRENALQCLQQVTNLDPLDAEKYLRLGAKASLAGPPQGTPSSGSMAAPPGADSDRKAWLRLARIVFANIIPDNKPTPACSNYEGVKGPPHPPGPEAPELPPQLPPRPLPKRHPADHWLDLAQAAVAAAKPRLAESYLERALELHPGEEESSRSALLYQQMKGYHRALRILDSLAQDRDSEKQARWLNDRGVLKALMGKDQEAAADLRAAIARDPDFLPAYLSLGGLWDSSGRRAEAMRTYRAALGRTAAGGHDEVRRRIRDEYERMRSAPARRRR
jgi:tetratricopeptide (TPR) repeat protein